MHTTVILAHFQLVKLKLLQLTLCSKTLYDLSLFKTGIKCYLYVPCSHVMCWALAGVFLCPDTLGSHATPLRLCLVIPLWLLLCVMTLNGQRSHGPLPCGCARLPRCFTSTNVRPFKRARSFVKVVWPLKCLSTLLMVLSPPPSLLSLLLFAQKYAGWPWFKFQFFNTSRFIKEQGQAESGDWGGSEMIKQINVLLSPLNAHTHTRRTHIWCYLASLGGESGCCKQD